MKSRTAILHNLHNCTDTELISTGVYTITSKLNGKIYVGSASVFEGISDAHLGFRARWGDHVFRLIHNRHSNNKLQNHVNKHGLDDLKFEILEICDSKFAIGLETYWTNMLGTIKDGFNLGLPQPNLMGKDHHRYIDLDINTIIKYYKEDKLTIKEIAKIFNVSTTPIKRTLKSANIKLTNFFITPEYSDLYKEYLSTYLTIEQLAKKYNIYPSTVKRGFVRNGFDSKLEIINKDIYKIYQRYLNGESVVKTISKDYKVSHDTIYRYFTKNNLKKFNENEYGKKTRKEFFATC